MIGLKAICCRFKKTGELYWNVASGPNGYRTGVILGDLVIEGGNIF